MTALLTTPSTGRVVANRVARVVPEPVSDRARLLLARWLEWRLRRSATVRGAALVFHGVAPRAGDRDLEIEPPVERGHLDAAIGYLKRHYALVRAAELPAAARARKRGGRLPVAVTFDDDLASHIEHAAPVFERHGAVATAFLCRAPAPFWWQRLQLAVDTRAIAGAALPHVPTELVSPAVERRPGAIGRLARAVVNLEPAHQDAVAEALARMVPDRVPMLEPEGVTTLVAAGWEIGYHTREHHLLTALDDDALRAALARRPAEPNGPLPRTLAYPYGKATAREAEAARLAGYDAAFTGYASVLTESTDDCLIGRLQPDTTTLGRFALQLARALSAA